MTHAARRRQAKDRVAAVRALLRACFGAAANGLSQKTRGSSGVAFLRQVAMFLSGDGDVPEGGGEGGGRAGLSAVATALGRDRSTVGHGMELVDGLRGESEDLDVVIGELLCAARAVEAIRVARASLGGGPRTREEAQAILSQAGALLRGIAATAPEERLPRDVAALLAAPALRALIGEIGLSADFDGPRLSVQRDGPKATVRLALGRG
ncbi:MAG: hypothetical protein ACRDD1_11305, partial [Planctomycetia bacterium]